MTDFTSDEAVKVLSQKFLMQEGIVGISHGSDYLKVYVEDEEKAKKVPYTLMGKEVDVVISGKFRTLQVMPKAADGSSMAGILASRSERWRPVPGGVSIGSVETTAGTNATRVFDASSGRKLLLSNRHVFYGNRGTAIVSPGKYDGGQDPTDRVGVIERFSAYRSYPDTNLIDAAVGVPVSDDLISDEVLDIGVLNGIKEAVVGMKVAKSGRTSGYTEGYVQDVHATIKVGGYNEGELVFEDQIITEYMGAPGDSGSIVVDATDKKVVGLLFAGSDTLTCVNKITNVCSELNITFGEAVTPTKPSMLAPFIFMPILTGIAVQIPNLRKK